MTSPTSHYARLAGREIHWMDWGPKEGPVILAWHGLARTGRDMDPLAAHFAQQGWRVICPDTIGRGLSQWSPKPDEEYCLSFYARLAAALFDELGLSGVHWIGTSMGGAIGLVSAGGQVEASLKPRIASLTLNDMAPRIADSAVARIRSYAGQPPAFDTVRELEDFFRTVYKPYGWLSDAQWRLLTESSVRRLPDGRVTPHYDPAMVRQFEVHPEDYDLWSHYDAIEVPVLCLRGAESDLVLPPTLVEMASRGPGAAGRLRVVEIEGCGHAPALNVPAHLGPIEQHLQAIGS